MEHKLGSSLNLSKNAPIGAMIASLLGALWVINYLTSFVTSYAGIPVSSLLDYVIGATSGSSAITVEMLFVVVARFIIAFGVSWGPITFLVSLIGFGRAILRGNSERDFA